MPSLSKYSSRWMCASRSPTPDGTQIYAETVFPVQPVLAKEDAQEEVDEWQRFETILTPASTMRMP